MEHTELKKETSIDWLMTQLYKKGFIKETDGNEPISLMNQAKEMEKQQQGYSEEEVITILREFYKVSSKKDFPFKNTIPLWFEKFKNK
jgi:hypothetical protein